MFKAFFMVVRGEISLIIPSEELRTIVEELRKIVAKLDEIKSALATERRVGARFITASEFMEAVKICGVEVRPGYWPKQD